LKPGGGFADDFRSFVDLLPEALAPKEAVQFLPFGRQ